MELSQEIKCNILEFFDSSMDSVRYVSCDSEMMKLIPSFVSSDYTVIDFMRPSYYYTPMAPFLKLLSQNPPEKSLVDEYAYSLQKDTFFSYFETEKCSVRKDVIVTSEISYEHRRCLRSLYEIFSHTLVKPIVILNSQLMDFDSFELVKMLEDSHRCKILLCLDLTDREFSTEESAFFSDLSSKPNFYETIRSDVHESKKNFSVVIEENNFFTFENIFNFFSNCKNFLSLGNSVSFAKTFLQEKSNYPFTEEQMAKILLEIAELLFYAGIYDDAEVTLNTVVASEVEEIKDRAYLFMARVLYAKTAYFDSYQYVKRLLDRNHLENRTYETFLAESYRCRILRQSLDESCDKSCEEEETEDIEGLSELANFEIFFNLTLDSLANSEDDFTNNYISTVLLIPYNEINSDPEKAKEYLKIIDECSGIAESINNEFAISELAKLKGDILSKLEEKEEGLELYNKADSIRRKLDDGQSSVHIRNSIVDEYILQGDYLKAFKVLHGVSDQILSLEDPVEIINTLSNVARIYLLIGYCAECRRLLNSITKILQVYNLKDSKIFSVNDANALQALIDIYYGKYTHAHLVCRNIKLNGIDYSSESNVILIVLSSLFALHNKELEKSKSLFEIAEQTLNSKIPESNGIENFESILKKYPNGIVESGEVGLPIKRDNLILPCGIYGRWVSND